MITEIAPLLNQAVRTGHARAVLDGVGARHLQARFGTTAPVVVEVRSLHRLPQPGCSRLQVHTRQAAVLEAGTRRDAELTYSLDHCAQGAASRPQ